MTPLPPVRLGVALAAIVLLAACGAEEPPPAPPPLEIAVAKVIQRDQPIVLEMVGETRGSTDVPIRARVDGFLQSMHFEEGRRVEKDQLLYTLDPAPFEARVAEAKGYVAEAETQVVKARSDLDRIRPLAEMKAVSEQDLDSAVAQYEAARGSRQAAKAQLEQARIELGYTKIHAPTGGRIGITEIELGEYVGAGPNSLLNYVSKIDPIRVRFAIDERNYLRIARTIAERGESPGEHQGPTLELVLADGTVHPHKGKTVATDAAIDAATGTFTLEADFANPDGIVLAGQFARVRGVVDEKKDALLIPTRVISELQGGFRAFVVGADGKVAMRSLELGPKVGRLQIVEQGVSVGESVALEGIQKLKDGMTVVPKPTALDEAGNVVETAAKPAAPPGA